MPDVSETNLPGVGVRHDFTTATGQRLGVIAHRGGRRELLVYDTDDPDACRTVMQLDVDDARTLAEVLGSIEPGDYIAINAFISRNKEHAERLQAIRLTLRDRYRVACSVGFGPRFLHSTGQLHKGGPAVGAFIEVLNEDAGDDLQIPGRSYTFRELLDAQALGDLAALLGRGRRACRVTLTGLETALRS